MWRRHVWHREHLFGPSIHQAARPGRLLTAALATLLLVAGCSSVRARHPRPGPPAGGSCPYTFAVITHGDNGNFWSVVYKGAKDAAKDTGCKLSETYGSQQQGQAQPDDNAENAQIQNAINAKVNGIVVSDHAPGAMNSTLAAAADAGIPVVLVNAGCDDADIAAAKAITCVGQPEQLAGKQAGQRFAKEDATNVLCVDPPVRAEPARPLRRHRAGPGRRAEVLNRRRPAVRARPAPS